MLGVLCFKNAYWGHTAKNSGQQKVTDQIVRLDLANEWGVTTEF